MASCGDPYDWRRLEALFHEAVNVAAEGRSAFLDRACGEDAGLRRELEELLSADGGTGGFDAPSPHGPRALLAAAIEDPMARVGARIGAYRLERLLGSGGMGTVWLAARADGQFEQGVAIKLIKRGMDTDEILRRFRRERQVLAHLKHPHIARLLDGGATADGRPYLVMEFIEGTTISEYGDEHGLSVADRLRLFQQVCAAVQYAHQNLVVHRDLKPSNIMVAADGATKLLDFGIAKILDPGDGPEPHITTAADLRLLTPRYASPEQVRREPVTTATDVYSLGVILYELLTGAEPYQLTTRSRAEYERAVCEQMPPRPSQALGQAGGISGRQPAGPHGDALEPARWKRRRRELSKDLDTIVLKALRKEPAERYSSVEHLAEDIRRFLTGHPVLATPQTRRYRAAKFVARNKLAVLSGLALFATLLGAAIVSTAFAVQAARQHALAEERLRLAETQAAIAQAINNFLNDDLLASASPERTPDREATVRSVLDAASERLGTRFADQPQVEASIRVTLGDTYEGLGELNAAELHYRRACELWSGTTGERSAESITALARLGNLKRLSGDLAEAEALVSRAYRLAEETYGWDEVATLTAAYYLGEVYIDQARYGEAGELLERLVEAGRTLRGPEHATTLRSLESLAVVYVQTGQYDEAERIHRQLVDAHSRAFGPDHPATISSVNNLAYLLMLRGDYAAAESFLLTAIERSRRVLGNEHLTTLTAVDNLGRVYGNMGRYDQAEQLHLEAHQALSKTLGPDHPNTLTALNNLALVYQYRGEIARAEPVYAELAAAFRRTRGADHPDTITAENNLAFSVMKLGRLAEAEEMFRDVVERRRRVLGADHPDTLGALSNLATARLEQGGYAEAGALVAEALALGAGVLPEDHPIIGVLFYKQGLCRLGLGEFEAAEESLHRASAVLTAALGPDHDRVAAVKEAVERLHAQRPPGPESDAAPRDGAAGPVVPEGPPDRPVPDP